MLLWAANFCVGWGILEIQTVEGRMQLEETLLRHLGVTKRACPGLHASGVGLSG